MLGTRWFLEKLQLREVKLWGFSRINFVRTLLSKRKLQWLIDQGKVHTPDLCSLHSSAAETPTPCEQVSGWDDPRFPTVAGVVRRGMSVAGLKTFILNMVIDATASRYTCLLSEGLIPCSLEGAPAEPFTQSLPLHPKDESLGKKIRFFAPTVLLQAFYLPSASEPSLSLLMLHPHPQGADDAATLEAGEEVTLLLWGNVIVKQVVKDSQGKVVSLQAALHLEGNVKATKKKLTWLADTPELTDVTLVEEDDNVEDLLTPTTRFVDSAKGEASLRQLKKGEVIQVERRGYYICDKPYLRPSDPIVLFFVPDGKNMF
ncbi:MAG: hypothetical protein SGPRY_008007, partial [Prymnesium sp.]